MSVESCKQRRLRRSFPPIGGEGRGERERSLRSVIQPMSQVCGAFSLTLTLSRWERELCRPSPGKSSTPDWSRTQPNRPPLPAGEGRGEGERPLRSVM